MNPYVIGGIILLAIIAIIAVYVISSSSDTPSQCVKLNGDCSADGSTCCSPNSCSGGICILKKDCVPDKKTCDATSDTCCNDGACVNNACCNQSGACKTSDDCCTGYQCNNSGYCYNPSANKDLVTLQYTMPPKSLNSNIISNTTNISDMDCKSKCKSTDGCVSAYYTTKNGGSCSLYNIVPTTINHGDGYSSMYMPHNSYFNGVNIKSGFTAEHSSSTSIDDCKTKCLNYKGDGTQTCVMSQFDGKNCWIINDYGNIKINNNDINMKSWVA